jgi:FkbM family methyltransferase
MIKVIQAMCLLAYREIAATGLLKTKLGKRIYMSLYDRYKAHLEAADVNALRTWVAPGSTVIDVGANIGFFTVRFARWAEPQGRVIAIEPEPENVRQLRWRIDDAGVTSSVEVIEGVVADQAGTLRLWLSPFSPAAHHLAADGIPVRAWTVDDLMAARGWPFVSLIKIDVDGAEVRVLRGARETITRWHPVLFVEVCDRLLEEAGFSAEMLLEEIERHGYRLYACENPHTPLTRMEAAARRQALGYADYLFRTP